MVRARDCREGTICLWRVSPPHEDDRVYGPDRQALHRAADDAQLEHDHRGRADFEEYDGACVLTFPAKAAEIGAWLQVIPPAPILQHTVEAEPPALRRLISKFDPAARDARNRTLGKRGEELALAFEQGRLRDAGRRDLARKVDWISESMGDGAGYDILSFTE